MIATYTQQSETAPAEPTSEQMSTSYEEGARSFPHIPDDDTERDAPGSSKRYGVRSGAQKVGQEHMFHQKVSYWHIKIGHVHVHSMDLMHFLLIAIPY